MEALSLSPVENQVNQTLSLKNSAVDETSSSIFDQILNSFSAMETSQVEAKTEMANVLMGTSDNSHGALIALQEAQLQMSFANAVREKVVQGVNQLYNMQI